MKQLIDILLWIVPVVLGGSLLWGLYDGQIESSHFIFFTSWSFGVIAPMTLVLRRTLAVILKEKIPYTNIISLVILTILTNGGGILIVLFVWKTIHDGSNMDIGALGLWGISFVSCALGYWFSLGTSLPTSKELRVHIKVRTALIISIFMSALQQLLYYIIMELLSFL